MQPTSDGPPQGAGGDRDEAAEHGSEDQASRFNVRGVSAQATGDPEGRQGYRERPCGGR